MILIKTYIHTSTEPIPIPIPILLAVSIKLGHNILSISGMRVKQEIKMRREIVL
jgi:hypothetical protein